MGIRKFSNSAIRIRNYSNHEIDEHHECNKRLDYKNEKSESHNRERMQVNFAVRIIRIYVLFPVVKALEQINNSKVSQ